MACVKNLRAETENLEEQDRMLRTKAAKLYAKVIFDLISTDNN
ncbi:putative membrane protein [Tatumella ptyseos ATCC 33301]|uniref:Putative membrane protein n=1 Tax=Tatumella ptyseos ATCC 33301 TaxID=1005995 RepID=A0A085JPT3_9GAMM|nr:putative membrane protein [Tatumella ptyseos ATCC 33301]